MEENAFQIPNSYMVNFGDPKDTNWCYISDEITKLNEKYPFQERENFAFFHGSGSGKHMRWFGFNEMDDGEVINHHMVEK